MKTSPTSYEQENYILWIQQNLLKWIIYLGLILSLVLLISAIVSTTTYFIGATLFLFLFSFCLILTKLHKYDLASSFFIYGVLFINILQGYLQNSAYVLCILSFILIIASIMKPSNHLKIMGIIITIFITLFHTFGILQWNIIKDPETGLTYVNNSSLLIPLLILSYVSSLIISNFIIKTINDQKLYIHQILTTKNELSKSILEIERQNEIRSSILANFSHELRTPLNSIIGFSEIIQDNFSSLSNEEKLNMIDDINKSGNLLLDLIQNVLDVSKIEKCEEKLNTTEFTLTDLIDNIKNIVKKELLLKNHQLFVNFNCSIEKYHGDYLKIRQILLNLFRNAIKFTQPLGIINMIVTDDPKYLIFIIEDNGIGMKKDDMIHLFEPFYQIKSNQSPISNGVGLGLYYTKLLVDLIRGEIFVESQLEIGSKFTVRFLKN